MIESIRLNRQKGCFVGVLCPTVQDVERKVEVFGRQQWFEARTRAVNVIQIQDMRVNLSLHGHL